MGSAAKGFSLLSPAMRLPPELLCNMFRIHQLNYIAFGSCIEVLEIGCDQNPYPVSSAWTSVTHVCRYWRTTALNCPMLWTTVSFNRRLDPDCSYARACLARSGKLPLVLQVVNMRHYLDLEKKEQLTYFMPLSAADVLRARAIYLYGGPSDLYTPLLKFRAPQLETLSAMLHTEDDDDDVNRSITLPLYFCGDTTAVKFLSVGSDCATFSPRAFGNLRQLHLLSIAIAETDNKLSGLLAALNANPRLELLALRHYYISTAIGSFDMTRYAGMVHLPNLREIALVDEVDCASAGRVFDFLQCLRHPGELALSISSDTMIDPSAAPINRLFGHQVVARCLRDTTLIWIGAETDNSIQLVCLGKTAAFVHDHCGWLPSVPRSGSLGPPLLLTAVNQVLLSCATSVLKSGRRELVAWVIQHSFRELILDAPDEDPSASVHLDALVRWLTGKVGDRGLPALKTLHIQGTHFDVDGMLCLVERRAVLSRPLDALHLHIEEDPDSLTDEARIQLQDWRARAAAKLSGHVKLEFHENSCYPPITLPPVCTAPAEWKWRGYDWAALM